MSAPATATCLEERIADGPAAGTMVRIYRVDGARRSAPIALHLHGGAFVGGSLECGGMISCLLAKAGATVVSAGYPLACEQPFPHGLDVAYGSLLWLYENRARFGAKKSPIFVAGEEAGGNLAAALALMARDQKMPPLAGQILLSPMLDACLATQSLRAAEAGSVGCKWADGWRTYLGSADKAAHPYAAPMGASRLAGMAPALVVTSVDDPMHDEALRYAARLREAGVIASAHTLPGPTGWPEAMADPLPDDGVPQATWAGAVQALFAAFLSDPLADLASLATAAPAAGPATFIP
ncbi:MAG: alpha/beta hydrolase [Xanthobacter sp. 35-67-6]|nr:MAG: alpha/beta hydrolase [Xanthobacter sp. 35-67-6]